MKQISPISVLTIDHNFVIFEHKDLVEKARGGDNLAFGQIYDLYFDKIYRFVYFRVNHREQAEDLTAEIFIRAWDKLAVISSPEAFPSWIFQIARNLVIDYYRSKKEHVDLTLVENIIEYEDKMVERTDLSFQQKSFLEALRRLPPVSQQVLRMKFLEDLDNREIAAVLEKSEGAVRVIQHRAIAELKNILGNHESS